jgi:hypothetical protein
MMVVIHRNLEIISGRVPRKQRRFISYIPLAQRDVLYYTRKYEQLRIILKLKFINCIFEVLNISQPFHLYINLTIKHSALEFGFNKANEFTELKHHATATDIPAAKLRDCSSRQLSTAGLQRVEMAFEVWLHG